MAIIQNVNQWDFRQALKTDEYTSWTSEAIEALYDHYDQLSDDMGEDIQLDPIAIRCEWSEYHVQELYDNYSHIFDDVDVEWDDYDSQVKVLNNHTFTIDIRRDTHMGNVLVMEF